MPVLKPPVPFVLVVLATGTFQTRPKETIGLEPKAVECWIQGQSFLFALPVATLSQSLICQSGYTEK